MGTPAGVAAAALALYVFTLLANLVVVQYAVGVTRGAVDEGARQGAAWGSDVDACLQRAVEVIDGLIGGYGERVSIECVDEGSQMAARAAGVFAGFVPPLPDFSFSVEARAVKERP